MAPQRSPQRSSGSLSDNLSSRRSRNSRYRGDPVLAAVTLDLHSERRTSPLGNSQLPRTSFHDLGVQTSSAARADNGPVDSLRSEVENLQHRKELLDAEVRLLEISKEKAHLEEKLNDSHKKYNAVIELRDHSFRCLKCHHVAQEPIVMRECAHVFCEHCLRVWFEDQMHKSLKDHKELDSNLKEPPFNLDKVKTLRESNYLTFAAFNCPCCGAYVWRRPKAIPFVTRVVDALSDALGVPENVAEKVVVNADEDTWPILFVDN